MPDRDLDLVLLGATGFTGALTAANLARRIGDRPWAIAGRSPERLEAIAEQLAPLGTTPQIRVADVGDPASLAELAASTRVLATTVGPYARLGRPVVEACVAAGTDYCDITGEPAFVAGVARDLHEAAVAGDVRVVHAAGFDSVPHDLAVHHAVSMLPDDEPITARGYVRAVGTASGGTAHSAADAVRELRSLGLPRIPTEGRRQSLRRPVPGRVDDPRGIALPMPTLDPQIVVRSAALLAEYGPDFTYSHHFVAKDLAMAATIAVGVGGLVGLALLPGGRRILDRVLPEQGTGPDPARRARSWFDVTVHAEAAGGARARAVVAGGDPGYGETSVMLAETALGLLEDDVVRVPGVVTPAAALGDTLRARLVGQGQRHEVELLS